MTKEKALQKARMAEKDLVEIAPKANPPVAKIISWSKYKYIQEKKKKASKGKQTELKEMWFNIFIDKGDMEHKLNKVREFIEDKDNVKITIKRKKGRVNRKMFYELMDKLKEQVSDFADIVTEPKFNGPNLTMIIGPKK